MEPGDAPPRVFKRCPECLDKRQDADYKARERASMFPSVLRTWNQYCPAHQDSESRLHAVYRVLNERAIKVECFDVWDADGNRVCRACGSRLLTKKGKQHSMLRWCQDKKDDPVHEKLANQTFRSFASARFDYINSLAHAQFDMIKEKFKDEIENGTIKAYKAAGSKPVWRRYFGEHAWSGWSDVIACEGCGNLATIDAHSFSRSTIEPAQVHHKRPVHTIEANEVMQNPKLIDLVFDHSNFIALCMTCHGKAHRKAPDPKLTRSKYLTMESFLK